MQHFSAKISPFLIANSLFNTQAFLGDSVGKESTCNTKDLGLIPELRRSPGEGKGYTLQYSCLQGQRSLEAYSPKVHKESDVT